MPSPVFFRESLLKDQPAIRSIFREASLSLHGAINPSLQNKSRSFGTTFMHVCEQGSAIVAVLQWRDLGREAEILDVAVPVTHRRQGHARHILQGFLSLARERGVRDIFLEVRESNKAAIALYRGLGFSETALRRNYYQRPEEAALLFRLKVSG